MAGKSGRKERHRAQNQVFEAINEFDAPEQAFQNLFGGSFGNAEGSGTPGELFQGGTALLNRLLPQLEEAIAGLSDPSGNPLKIGLSAPGILEGLIARSQEGVASQSQAAARSASGFLPSRGGAAQRAIGDIFQSGAGDAANIETQLRAQAAQQDLQNRLGIIGGLTGGMGSVQNTAGFGLNSGLDLAGFLNQIAGQRSNVRRGLANQLFDQARQKRSARNAGNLAIGQGISGLIGAGAGALAGGGGATPTKGGGGG